MSGRPDDIYDRVVEWDDLWSFASGRGAGLGVGVVYGRRRQGKSYLLRRLTRAKKGFYYQALEEEGTPALEHLGTALGQWLGVPGGQLGFDNWVDAIDALTRLGRDRRTPTVVVIDEFPYLLDRVPELSSILQRTVDASRDAPGAPVRLILCGSALSIMTGLMSGQRALRGRVGLTLNVEPFDYREAAAYWGLEGAWDVAVQLHAILGGTPGYRDVLGLDPPKSVDELGQWLAAGVCNPASAMFREDEFLLAEEKRLTDRALYHSVLGAIANGHHTETKIAGVLGRDRQSLAWPLRVLTDAGFVVRDDDVLRQRRPTWRVAEPIVRFHHVVTRPDLARFEERQATQAWTDARQRFSTHVLGPHFEDLARRWTLRYASVTTLGGRITRVGSTQVNDAAGRSQFQLDVIGLAEGGAVRLIGEAKFRTAPPGLDVLDRLEKILGLIKTRAATEGTKLAIFSATGFSTDLVRVARQHDNLELVDLERLYTGN